MEACEYVSRRICRLLTGQDMTLCAYAHWRSDKGHWRRAAGLLDRLLLRVERDHCRRSFERRFPDR